MKSIGSIDICINNYIHILKNNKSYFLDLYEITLCDTCKHRQIIKKNEQMID